MTSTTYVTLNLQAPNTAVTVNAKQNDRLSRCISAALYDGSVTFVPPVGASAAIRYKKPDGTGGFYDADEDTNPAIVITGSTALLTLAEQCTTVPGEVYMELNFYTAAGDKLTSFTWLLKVEQSVLTDATIVSSDYYNVLTAAISTTLEYRDAAAASATAAAASATTAEYWAGIAQGLTAGIKGYFATPAALAAAYPVGQDGWWAIVGTTDTVWVWDSDTTAWTDTGDVSFFYTKTESDARFATAAQGLKADTAVQPAGLIAASVSIADAGNYFTATNVEGALQALALGRSAQLGVPFLTGGIDKATNKPIWCIMQDHTFASLAVGQNTAFSVSGVTKFISVEVARVFGNDIVCGAQPVGSLATFATAQGAITRSAVELFLWGSAVATSTTWRFIAYYTL